jgi:hypothetical protein
VWAVQPYQGPVSAGTPPLRPDCRVGENEVPWGGITPRDPLTFELEFAKVALRMALMQGPSAPCMVGSPAPTEILAGSDEGR